MVGKFTERYEGGTKEGSRASRFFDKWGWYDTIVKLAKGNILRINKVLEINVYEMHTFLAHLIDKEKLKAELRTVKKVLIMRNAQDALEAISYLCKDRFSLFLM